MFLLLIGVLTAVVVFSVILYNRLVRSTNLVREAWAGIDVQLKRRHDLIPPLVAAVKGYMQYEDKVFTDVARLRAQGISGDPTRVAPEENEVSRRLREFFALAEAYPELRASESFIHLQRNLSEVEDTLQMARRYYNGAVRDNNVLVDSIPTCWLAPLAGVKKEPFFELERATEAASPDISLQK
jgi:LemA protein